MAHLARLERKFDTIVPGAVRALPTPDAIDPIDQFEEQLKPANKAINLAKWVLGVTVPIFLAGSAWQSWGDALATQGDIQDHIDADFKPMQAQVSVVHANVGQLLREAKRDREIANLERRVDSYQAVFDSRMDRYHGSRARWPDKYFREPEANERPRLGRTGIWLMPWI